MDTNERTPEEILAEIADKAPVVAEQAVDMASAIDEERAAEAALLAKAIEAVRPALRALGSKIKSSWGATSGRNGCNPLKEEDFYRERGVLLVDNFDSKGDGTGNRGSLTGDRLYLTTDGQFAEVTREGEWSHWQGEWDRYTTDWRWMTPAEVTCGYDVGKGLSALAGKLDKQLAGKGKAPERAKAARERAERLRAVVALAK